jgi:hypothetical protein
MADPAVEDILDLIATVIAEKVVERLGGSPPAAVQPPDTSDAEDPDPEEEATPETDDTAEEEADVVPESYKEFVAEEVEAADTDKKKTDLQEFYVDILGNSKKSITATLKEMGEEEITSAYTDYCARLVKVDEDGDLAYIEDFSTPYQAARVNDGEEALVWCVGGRTLTEEEVEEQGLNEEPEAEKPKKKKGPPAAKKGATKKRTK